MNPLNIVLLVIFTIVISGLSLYYGYGKFKKEQAAKKKKWTAASKKRKANRRRYIQFYWLKPLRFIWTSIILSFFLLLGIALNNIFGLVILVISFVLFISFLVFAWKSYHWFPAKAKEKLDTFEKTLKNAIDKEMSFDGDNIQKFTDDDKGFDTTPQIFSLPVSTTKFKFPPYESNPIKQPIVKTRKIEFLVLSREYFSVCQNTTEFNLLNPVKKILLGECHEYYYSQIQNVKYENGGIKIIYYHESGDEDIVFKGKKNPAIMKALKEKLRLTERQRLRKMDEHRHYEELKEKREKVVS
jgi:NADH:ubiquinone oxidoreductase subunit 3 (subunit A)